MIILCVDGLFFKKIKYQVYFMNNLLKILILNYFEDHGIFRYVI